MWASTPCSKTTARIKWVGQTSFPLSLEVVYKTFAVAKTANAEYQEESDRWEELYGDNAQKQEKESIHKRLQNYQRENADRQTIRTSKNKDKGAR